MQDQARADGYREGEGTVNMRRSGWNRCWARAVMWPKQGWDKNGSSGQVYIQMGVES